VLDIHPTGRLGWDHTDVGEINIRAIRYLDLSK